MRTKILASAALAVVASVLGTACGGDDDGAADTTAAAPDAAATTAAAAGPATTSGASGGAAAAPGTISIQNFAFPSETRVAPGSTVTVENGDGSAHTVTSVDAAFSIEVSGDETGEFTAPTEPGEYPFVCNFHDGMKGVLIVE